MDLNLDAARPVLERLRREAEARPLDMREAALRTRIGRPPPDEFLPTKLEFGGFSLVLGLERYDNALTIRHFSARHTSGLAVPEALMTQMCSILGFDTQMICTTNMLSQGCVTHAFEPSNGDWNAIRQMISFMLRSTRVVQ